MGPPWRQLPNASGIGEHLLTEEASRYGLPQSGLGPLSVARSKLADNHTFDLSSTDSRKRRVIGVLRLAISLP